VPIEVTAPVTVRPAARAVAPTVWRLQAAALRDEVPAFDLARRLEAASGEPARVAFDAGAGLYRVRVGGWPSRETAEAAARRLRDRGLEGAWAVAEGGGITDPALEIVEHGRVGRVAGRRFTLRAADGNGLRFEGRRYRGALEVYLNDRGRLNVVNELPLEQYLRGVVPRELGPSLYPELEALKAQAVAARSYTIRNLDGFAGEGYDLCARPQCQVYGGMDDEHPLSDRAVAETAGEVMLFEGEAVDALYTATCGGHTENVEVVFPLRRAPYLRGVPCIEAGGTRLAGIRTAADPLAVLAGGLPPDVERAGEGAAGLERALIALVRAAGLEPPVDRLRSLVPLEVRRFLGSQLDLAADPRLFAGAGPLGEPVAGPPAGWRQADLRFAVGLAASGLGDELRARPLEAGEARELALRTAIFLGIGHERSARFAALADGRLVVRDGDGERTLPLATELATFHRRGGRLRAASLLLVPGDEILLLLRGERVLAVVQEGNPRAAGFEFVHQRASWSRNRSDAELARLVRVRYPGFELTGLEVLERGVSGRVARLRLRDAAGATLDLEGLSVRWTLDLPDTLFTVRRRGPAGSAPGWSFTGRGWGHGVGMCQSGAFGMARRGLGYRAILGHYYSGVRIERLMPATPSAPRA
jgi:stage II sporulation protein D